MFDLLFHLVIIGVATALEPVQLIAYVGVISTRQGIRAGWAFLGGWIASLLTVSLLTWVAAAQVSSYASDVVERRGVRRGILAVELILGLALLAYAIYRERRGPRPAHESRLKVGGATMTTTHAALVGLLIPPWPLVAAGALDVVRAEVGVTRSVAAMLVYLVTATSTIGGMQLWAVRSPETSLDRLARIRAWLEPHAERIITVIAALVGLWLVVRVLRRW